MSFFLVLCVSFSAALFSVISMDMDDDDTQGYLGIRET